MVANEIENRFVDIDPIYELKEWLFGRIGDEDDVVVDQIQEEFASEWEKIEANASHPYEGSDLWKENQHHLSNGTKTMKEKEARFTSESKITTDGIRKCRYGGTVDSNGLPFGEGQILFDNKDSFVGRFNHSILDREGKMLRAEESCLYTEGTWKNGLMEGEMTIHTHGGGFVEGYFHNGVPHGFQREFGINEKLLLGKKSLVFFGRFYRGIRRGFCWKGLFGGGFLVGNVDEETGEFSGPDLAYIYPDFKRVLRGSFKDGVLVSGRMCELNGCDVNKGIHMPTFSHFYGQEYTFDNPTIKMIGLNPLIRDPYEEDNVFVKESLLPQGGEGLFAKKDIQERSVFCLYNGIRIKTSTSASSKLPHSDYRIRLNADIDLDIPHDFITLDKYCATVGHKINHSFTPNSEWTLFEHPRFGIIRGIRAQRKINQSEEILINYHMNLCDSPEWYRVLWIQHQRKKNNSSDAAIARIMDRYYENTGKKIPLPENEELIVPDPVGVQNIDELDDEDLKEIEGSEEAEAKSVTDVKKLFHVKSNSKKDEDRFEEIHDFNNI
uniref:SET domain-containing protein n=3 Tax=Lepeophtheirus salmonis TaxID=72036 RepID=A0A0K2UHP2_LEPSM